MEMMSEKPKKIRGMKPNVIILDDNPISLALYMEEHPKEAKEILAELNDE